MAFAVTIRGGEQEIDHEMADRYRIAARLHCQARTRQATELPARRRSERRARIVHDRYDAAVEHIDPEKPRTVFAVIMLTSTAKSSYYGRSRGNKDMDEPWVRSNTTAGLAFSIV